MYFFIIVYLSFIYCADSTTTVIPKLDLRDGVILKNINLNNIIPEDKGRIISEGSVNKIKENAQNFINSPVNENDIVIMETSQGTLELELYPDKAPNHCNNFKKLANSGFYDGTLFHRVIPGFMIQGGDILSRDLIPENDGTGNPGWTINQEFNDIKHERGILSMARSQDVNSAGSQFFICVASAYHLDSKYTVFGKVISNDFVLDKITKIPSQAKQILNNSRPSIPENEIDKNWLSYNFGGKKWYIKKHEYRTMEDFEIFVKNQLRNKHKTHIPVVIDKIRVIDTSNDTGELKD